jgi:glycine oxidase
VASWPGRPTREPVPDVIIIGGGVIGCACAYHLVQTGARVLLLERDRLAAGASGVAAGMLAPQAEAIADDALFALNLRGRAEHQALAAALLAEVGLDVECRLTGVLRVARTEAERADLLRRRRWQTARGLRAEWLEPAELGQIEPLLGGVAGRLLAGGLWLPDEGQVRGPSLIQALALASVKRGVRILEGTPALALVHAGARVVGVRTPAGVTAAGAVVLAAGVWSGALARDAGLALPVGPVKGQIMTLRSLRAIPRAVIWSGGCYLAPKADGQILLGATEEDGNYDPHPTLSGVNALTTEALEFLPAAGQLTVEGLWAGLRPAAPDRHPIIGRAPGRENLIVATAHYRHGILLGPLTGRWVAQLVQTGAAAAELAAFAPDRFGDARAPA